MNSDYPTALEVPKSSILLIWEKLGGAFVPHVKEKNELQIINSAVYPF